MHHIRRWSVPVFVVVLFATLSVVPAQGTTLGGTYATEANGTRLVESLVGRTDDLLARLYEHVREALLQGILALEQTLSESLPLDGVCVYLVGTGGSTPRLDGGGDLLAAMDLPFREGISEANPSDARIVGYSQDHAPDLYIIDEFSIEALAVSLQQWIDMDVQGLTGTSEGGVLWDAMYGYRISLRGDEPRQAESTSVPHGHLVAYHALSQLPSGSSIQAVRMSDDDRRVEVDIFHPGSDTITVHFVAIEFDKPASITAGLSDVPHGESAVVVMSWGLVDCLLAAGYEALPPDSDYETIMEYFAAAIRAHPNFVEFARGLCGIFDDAGAGQLLELAEGQNCEDLPENQVVGLAAVAVVAGFSEFAVGPDQIEWDPDPRCHVYFAAAGNQGLGFPMPPASWSGVRGVEANVFGETGKASFSNAGSIPPVRDPVRALGAWFVTPEVHSADENVQLGYFGTSFAAPTAALQYLSVADHTETCVGESSPSWPSDRPLNGP